MQQHAGTAEACQQNDGKHSRNSKAYFHCSLAFPFNERLLSTLGVSAHLMRGSTIDGRQSTADTKSVLKVTSARLGRRLLGEAQHRHVRKQYAKRQVQFVLTDKAHQQHDSAHKCAHTCSQQRQHTCHVGYLGSAAERHTERLLWPTKRLPKDTERLLRHTERLLRHTERLLRHTEHARTNDNIPADACSQYWRS